MKPELKLKLSIEALDNFSKFMAERDENNNCITFNKAAQDAIPSDVRAQMDADRAEAERQSI